MHGARVQEVNLTSVYYCCKYAIPYMQEQGKRSIINTASFVAVLGAATSQISYSASKGGVLAMSRELGVEFARQGIRVNAPCPGPVNTPLLKELFAKDPEKAARRLVHVPLGRFAEPEELAAAVAFLDSDDSSFMTASTFPRGRRDLRSVCDGDVIRQRLPYPAGTTWPVSVALRGTGRGSWKPFAIRSDICLLRCLLG
jgi:NAD(P)-dependent dehydrogenase (short-subunit alcohol dehydrogenase family)